MMIRLHKDWPLCSIRLLIDRIRILHFISRKPVSISDQPTLAESVFSLYVARVQQRLYVRPQIHTLVIVGNISVSDTSVSMFGG